MTPEERDFARTLVRCKIRPGSWDKRFARDMAGIAEQKPDKQLTDRQREFLLKLVVRYRKQIDAAMVERAKEWLQEASQSPERK